MIRCSTAVILVGLALASPGLETMMRRRIADALNGCSAPGQRARCGFRSIDVDLFGIRVEHPWIERGSRRVEAGSLEVRPRPRQLELRVNSLTARLKSHPKGATVEQQDNHASAAPWAIPHPPVPIVLAVPGSVRIELAPDIALTLSDLLLRTGPDEPPTSSFAATFRYGGRDGQTVGRATATIAPDAITGSGEVSLLGGDPTPVVARIHKISAEPTFEASVTFGQGRRNRLRAQVRRQKDPPTWAVRVDANDVDLAPWFAGAAPMMPRSIQLKGTRFTGAVAASFDQQTTEVVLRDARLVGLAIDDPRLARDPVRMGPIDLDMTFHRFQGQTRLEGTIAHGKLRGSVSGRANADNIEVEAGLSRIDCADLLAGLPAGFSGVLAGTRLAGEFEAGLRIKISRAQLDDARAVVAPRSGPYPPLGELYVRVPFLEQCHTIAEPPVVDVAALRGAYRHQFVDALGDRRTRWLTRGASNYAALGTVPQLARAFVTLEDARFWRHDGFDREQMRSAVWHNLVVRKIARGASTITQQAARNLFLGVDRSLSRKVQEAYLASRLEHGLTKARILEIYLNIVELGPGIHGVGPAARFYFGKPATALNLLEAVHLAKLAPAPHRYAERFEHGVVDQPWMDEVHTQLRRLYRRRQITRRQLRGALRADLDLLDRKAPTEPG